MLDSKFTDRQPAEAQTASPNQKSMSQTATTSMINVTLPDGSKKEVPAGTTALDIAK